MSPLSTPISTPPGTAQHVFLFPELSAAGPPRVSGRRPGGPPLPSSLCRGSPFSPAPSRCPRSPLPPRPAPPRDSQLPRTGAHKSALIEGTAPCPATLAPAATCLARPGPTPLCPGCCVPPRGTASQREKKGEERRARPTDPRTGTGAPRRGAAWSARSSARAWHLPAPAAFRLQGLQTVSPPLAPGFGSRSSSPANRAGAHFKSVRLRALHNAMAAPCRPVGL